MQHFSIPAHELTADVFEEGLGFDGSSIRGFQEIQDSGYYHLDSIEGVWNSGRETEHDGSANLGYKVRYKEGYFPLPPMDQYQDLRSEMMLTLEQVGIPIEVQHHEVGTAGQAEINM